MARMEMANVKETWFEDWEKHFGELDDPRVDGRIYHPLMDILMLGLCGIISGAEGWVEVEQFGKTKLDWLKNFLQLPNGIPSHDTIGRVFSLIDPNKFKACFITWARELAQRHEGLISIDGKALRASNDQGEPPVTIVSAWSARNQIVLGQTKTDEKSNEITAIPKLIDSIDVTGSIVSIDAAGCQKNIAEKLIESGADYLIALKGNQGHLHNEVSKFLSSIRDQNVYGENIDESETVGKGHGRIEKRVCLTSTDTLLLPTTHPWKGLQTVIMIEAQRVLGEKSSVERRYYISSAKRSAQEFNELIRGHWGVENQLHWVLDVGFREDQCRVRAGFAAENYATLRHIALNLIKQDKTRKGGIKSKRMQAGWDHDFLLSLIGRI
jgi:predicted transposase YbfD/YdcC